MENIAEDIRNECLDLRLALRDIVKFVVSGPVDSLMEWPYDIWGSIAKDVWKDMMVFIGDIHND